MKKCATCSTSYAANMFTVRLLVCKMCSLRQHVESKFTDYEQQLSSGCEKIATMTATVKTLQEFIQDNIGGEENKSDSGTQTPEGN